MRENLPHKHKHKFYTWSRKFFESKKRQNFLLAGNQIGKSTVQIKKCIEWATNPELWGELWNSRPRQFWYLYPSQKQGNSEFDEKWLDLMPGEALKDDPIYGWKRYNFQGGINRIKFNSGVSIYFKYYSQNPQSLQSGTVHAVFCDEELLERHFSELQFRLAATRGYFHMVFTPTLGLEIWRKTMEPKSLEEELFPDALKMQVSTYDCLKYEDGSPGPWTVDSIKQVEYSCATKNEVLKRVYGRFVLDSGLKYGAFDPGKNMEKVGKIEDSWSVYVAVDSGSGGATNHPASICFIAVNPEYTKGVVFRGWRGDGLETTSSDLLDKYRELRGALKPIAKKYDQSDRDFFIISSRAGEGFTPSDKGHETGERMINTLFKHGALMIAEGDSELQKLVTELMTLQTETAKRKARDDFIDAMRYCVTAIPWDWQNIAGDDEFKEKKVAEGPPKRDILQERRDFVLQNDRDAETMGLEQELEEWNSLYG